jgi:hypothetical protein
MKGATVALILLGVAAAGGGAYFFLIRKKGLPGKEEARGLGAAQSILGAKAVQMGIPQPPPPPGKLQPWQTASAVVAGGGGGGGSGASSPYAKQVFGAAGKIADMWYPGLGSKAASIASAIDSKIGLGLIAKVPGLKKLKFW